MEIISKLKVYASAYKDVTDPPRSRSSAQQDPARRAKEIEILKRLNTSPYRDQKERNPERIQSGSRLMSSFETGMRASHQQCSGYLQIQDAESSILATTESRTTCYFFFKDDFEDQRNVISALCCILHQLVMQKRILLSKDILEQFEVDGERLIGSFVDLWAILLSIVKDKNAGEIICVSTFDLIDECEDLAKRRDFFPPRVRARLSLIPIGSLLQACLGF